MSDTILLHPPTRSGARLGLRRPELLNERAYIDGAWIDAEGCLPVENPARGEIIGRAPALGAAAAAQAVGAAQAALGPWRKQTASARGRVLKQWARLMSDNAEDLARIMTAEQGKPLAESLAEIAYAAGFLEWFAEEGRRAYGDVIPAPAPDRRLVVVRQPVGVVGAITPWNFPSAMITRKAGPALAVGCTFVVKPSELTPFSALALAKLAEEAGVPPGVFNVVTGDAEAIGAVLTGDPRVRKFTFTGSTAVGKMLAARCMGTVKRLSLELGGNAPLIVFRDADLDQAVEGAMASKFRNSGQTCVCANRILVHEALYDAFAERLAERVGELVLGDGLAGPCDQGPLIDERAVAKVERLVADAVARGAVVRAGGRRRAGVGHFYEPTVLAGVTPDMAVAREEIFGPVAALLRFRDETDAIAMANETPAGLAAYVFTSSLERAWRTGEALAYGMVGLNTGLISSVEAPFGGVKESGFGREGSSQGLDDYLETKLLCLEVRPVTPPDGTSSAAP